jgi:hypothetical protein
MPMGFSQIILWLKPFKLIRSIQIEWAKAQSYSYFNPIDESNLNCLEWAKAQSYSNFNPIDKSNLNSLLL